MDKLDYLEIKEDLLEDLDEYVNNLKYTREQAIVASFEDCTLMMKAYKDNYVSVIIILSVLSLKNDMIDDFIYERLVKTIEKYLDDYTFKDVKEFLEDKIYLEERLKKQDYSISDKAKYKNRANLLLEEI